MCIHFPVGNNQSLFLLYSNRNVLPFTSITLISAVFITESHLREWRDLCEWHRGQRDQWNRSPVNSWRQTRLPLVDLWCLPGCESDVNMRSRWVHMSNTVWVYGVKLSGRVLFQSKTARPNRRPDHTHNVCMLAAKLWHHGIHRCHCNSHEGPRPACAAHKKHQINNYYLYAIPGRSFIEYYTAKHAFLT